ncbi:unnamed protein product [Pseudo-nitzschia multistriata]|uniref:Rhodanese domain-containing protein n=1 Tax=Pseudo-nitzschia multistriata TaxID=183589 RepID=A0A448ZEQ2_9STRA|nr:unnamed protein product [Pseudo-nitzschia multistriata]
MAVALPSAPAGAATRASGGIILFYKYHPLSDNRSIVDMYRGALERFCASLNLKGRILVGCSEHRSEGINGTLSGTRPNLEVFVRAFTETDSDRDNSIGTNNPAEPAHPSKSAQTTALARFQSDCREFYRAAGCPPLQMKESEFKWSKVDETKPGEHQEQQQLFPDLNIKIVKELIGTGGVLSSIHIDQLHEGYLTPREWHERIARLNATKRESKNGSDNVDQSDNSNDTILIDCRNTKEYAIGNFAGSIDPQTTTFNQFPKWVDEHKHKLRNKSVLMYCTGGIRCEKASAYVRHAMGTAVKEVRHLQGGIHKYLEEFGSDNPTYTESSTAEEGVSSSSSSSSLWRGKNFVFDGRGAHGPASDGTSKNGKQSNPAASASTTVGTCRYCKSPYDSFDPHCVCTVCKEPILVCKSCQACSANRAGNAGESSNGSGEGCDAAAATASQLQQPQHELRRRREYHCEAHRHLEECYFTNLEGFSPAELSEQLEQLETLIQEIAVGKKFKQRRKTLAKQCSRVRAKLAEQMDGEHANGGDSGGIELELKCRNCGQVGCSGKCWGFHGLKRKRILEERDNGATQLPHTSPPQNPTAKRSCAKTNRHNEKLKERKELQKQKQVEDWISLGLTLGPKAGRDPATGLRVPKPCVRVLETNTKGKWCGKALLKVLQTEFPNSFQQQPSTSITESDRESQLDAILRTLFEKGLIRVNGNPIRNMDEANSYKLKNMDVIDRIVYWHEPPIHLPTESIEVRKIPIPMECFPPSSGMSKTASTSDYGVSEFDRHIYVCNKPSTVPVHPAGPYLSNSLTLLVEAQEGLPPKTLIPCHRIDRATSGVTICCADPRVARVVQTTISGRSRVQKEYLARVGGRFPANNTEDDNLPASVSPGELARWKWIGGNQPTSGGSSKSGDFLQVDAPIETVDPLNGIRRIASTGKASTSQFRLLEYDSESNTSILACVPVTGRSHQLRVHLQWLGHSIVDDVQYGGGTSPGSAASLISRLDPSAGIHRVLDNLREDTSPGAGAPAPVRTSLGVTDEQSKAARDVCPTTDTHTGGRGPSGTFSPAQLLQGGHAICLHAHRYALSFGKGSGNTGRVDGETGNTKENNDGGEETFHRIELEVDLPPWASHLTKDCIP